MVNFKFKLSQIIKYSEYKSPFMETERVKQNQSKSRNLNFMLNMKILLTINELEIVGSKIANPVDFVLTLIF